MSDEHQGVATSGGHDRSDRFFEFSDNSVRSYDLLDGVRDWVVKIQASAM
jgi:hypothetical protein